MEVLLKEKGFNLNKDNYFKTESSIISKTLSVSSKISVDDALNKGNKKNISTNEVIGAIKTKIKKQQQQPAKEEIRIFLEDDNFTMNDEFLESAASINEHGEHLAKHKSNKNAKKLSKGKSKTARVSKKKKSEISAFLDPSLPMPNILEGKAFTTSVVTLTNRYDTNDLIDFRETEQNFEKLTFEIKNDKSIRSEKNEKKKKSKKSKKKKSYLYDQNNINTLTDVIGAPNGQYYNNDQNETYNRNKFLNDATSLRNNRSDFKLPHLNNSSSKKNNSASPLTNYINNESLRWHNQLNNEEEEEKRIELYKINRRKRYIEQRNNFLAATASNAKSVLSLTINNIKNIASNVVNSASTTNSNENNLASRSSSKMEDDVNKLNAKELDIINMTHLKSNSKASFNHNEMYSNSKAMLNSKQNSIESSASNVNTGNVEMVEINRPRSTKSNSNSPVNLNKRSHASDSAISSLSSHSR